MTSYDTVESAIAAGAQYFAEAEAAARQIKVHFRELRQMFETINLAGFIGGLEGQALAGSVDALATKFEADLYAAHLVLTKRAQELGIDLPALRDGGSR